MAKGDPGDLLVSGTLAFGMITALMWFYGITMTGMQMSVLLVVLLSIGFLTREAVDRSFGFGVITVSLLLVIASLAPDWVSAPFVDFVTKTFDLIGVSIGFINPTEFAVLAIGFTILMLIIRYRITGKKKSIRNAAVLAGNDIQLYVREYLTIGRIIVLTGFTAFVFLFQQSGQVLGTFGDVIVDVPYISANLVTILSGYLSLGGEAPLIGGDVPLIGTMGAADFLVLGVVLLFMAAAVNERGRGRMAQFLRNRGL